MGLKTTSKAGKIGERFAVSLLLEKGYKILQKNFRSKFGEIDIVAMDGDCLVFVEVKTRWNKNFGLPEEAVTQSKIWKITRTAEFYMLKHPDHVKKQRIEVVSLLIDKGKVQNAKIITVN